MSLMPQNICILVVTPESQSLHSGKNWENFKNAGATLFENGSNLEILLVLPTQDPFFFLLLGAPCFPLENHPFLL